MWRNRHMWKLFVLGLFAGTLALGIACASGGASKEDVDLVAADVEKVKAQVAAAAPAADVAKVKEQVSAALAAVGPKTHRLQILMGEGEVIGEEAGKEALTGEFHRWEPDVMVVNKGDTVILEVTNPRSTAHSFVLKEFTVDSKELAPRGGKATVQFVANKAGVFQYECGIDPAKDPYKARTDACDLDHRRQLGYLIVLER